MYFVDKAALTLPPQDGGVAPGAAAHGVVRPEVARVEEQEEAVPAGHLEVGPLLALLDVPDLALGPGLLGAPLVPVVVPVAAPLAQAPLHGVLGDLADDLVLLAAALGGLPGA